MDEFLVYRIRQSADRVVTAAFETATIADLDVGEVVVEVAYSSINYKDALAASGRGKIIRRFPCIGGIDLAGTIVTSTDDRYRSGDSVIVTSYDLGVAHDGGYAHYARVPADWVVPLPDGLSVFEAMAYGTAGYTAALAIVRMETNDLTPRQGPVVVTGATGGVGSIAVAMLAKRGYHVIALTGKPQSRAYLTSLGATEFWLRDDIDFERVKPLERAQFAGAVDNLGGTTLAWLLANAKQGAAIGSVGLAAATDLSTTVMPFILRGVSLLGIDSGYTPMSLRRKVWSRIATDLRWSNIGSITRSVRFAALPEWFPRFVAGQIQGRVVVDIKAK